jgi:hypothetical protein
VGDARCIGVSTSHSWEAGRPAESSGEAPFTSNGGGGSIAGVPLRPNRVGQGLAEVRGGGGRWRETHDRWGSGAMGPVARREAVKFQRGGDLWPF